MIAVDTSILINYFQSINNPKIVAVVNELIRI